ncbi:MAG TPA: tetraacyldisaccharide 4'-kinase [Pseudomonadales bacterium]
MVERNLSPLARAWYAQSGWLGLLAPLSWIYGVVARRRRLRFLTGRTNPWRATVPVIVVGNITAGGTGKTPFTIWLVRALRSLGLRPGIVSRGHGGRDNREPVLVSAASSADSVGDEAPMLAARSAVPTVVCRDRVRAVQTLLQSGDCNVVVADDGLQHYGLARDIEIALIDGHRGLGNRRLLPAGPLREPQQRLGEVDWVVSTGRPSGAAPQEWLMKIEPVRFVGLGGQSPDLSVEAFAGKFVNVNAVAGIGNPGRFLQTLKEMGLQPLLTAYPDHHRFSGSELVFDNGWPVVCTEKDATKIRALGELPDNLWYLEVQGRVTGPHGEAGVDRLAELLAAHGIRHR